MAKLAPSILSADFSKLGEQIRQIEEAGAHYIHMDVMDGHFVPNITFGPPLIKSLVGKTALPFDIHLMVENPDLLLEEFCTEQTEFITVHQEACVHLQRTVSRIKSLGAKAGVVLNPATSLSTLDYIIEEIDMVLIMSVNPGFGGQKFIETSWRKIRELDELRKKYNPELLIELDGGVNLDNASVLKDAGVDILVAGAAVFGAGDVAGRVREFLREIS